MLHCGKLPLLLLFRSLTRASINLIDEKTRSDGRKEKVFFIFLLMSFAEFAFLLGGGIVVPSVRHHFPRGLLLRPGDFGQRVWPAAAAGAASSGSRPNEFRRWYRCRKLQELEQQTSSSSVRPSSPVVWPAPHDQQHRKTGDNFSALLERPALENCSTRDDECLSNCQLWRRRRRRRRRQVFSLVWDEARNFLIKMASHCFIFGGLTR